MSVELSVIIVNWNGGELLRQCVESILEAPPAVSHDFIIIDNASSDDSIARLRASGASTLGDRLRIVENTENLGFGRANNQGFALTAAPLLLILNPDTEVTPGAIDKLIATVSSGERVGGAGPRLLNADGSLQVSVWRNPPAAWEMLVTGLKLHLLLPKRIRGELLLANHWQHNRRRVVNMLSGAAMLIKHQVIDEVGGFDDRFHMYGEDNEWCLRIVRAGWTLVFEPDSVIMHHGAASSLKRWDAREKARIQATAFLDFQRLCLPRRKVIANLMTSCFLLSLQRVSRKLRGIAAEDVEMTLRLYTQDLKRALRERRAPRAQVM